jgi:hypothetical protein
MRNQARTPIPLNGKKVEKKSNSVADLLSIFASGVLTVDVNGMPFVKVDAESKSVGVEAMGIKECGLRLSKLIRFQGGRQKGGIRGLLESSESAARSLSEDGWQFTLYDRGSRVLTMGRGVSRLSGFITVNPLRLGGILEAF